MKLKLIFGLIFVILLSGLAVAQVDKVMVVNYDSVDDMMDDLNKLKPQKASQVEDSSLKTWTYCKRSYCYEVPVVKQVIPVIKVVPSYTTIPVLTYSYTTTHAHAEPVRKYHYNSHDGVYTNDWDAIEDHYREHHRYDGDDDHIHSKRSYYSHHTSSHHHWY